MRAEANPKRPRAARYFVGRRAAFLDRFFSARFRLTPSAPVTFGPFLAAAAAASSIACKYTSLRPTGDG